MTKAYSYLRFSTPEQLHGDSFRRQSTLAQEYCGTHGLTLDTQVTYHDLGVSAFRGKNAETGRLAEFLEAVKSGLVPEGSALLVESLDRMSRQAARKALRVLEAICDEGITVVTLNDGKQYTREALDSDPMALIMSLLVFIRANEESQMKSKRLKAAWVGKREKAIKGGHTLTKRCPGWLQPSPEGGFTLIRERAQVVRRIFELASKGIGPHSIAEALNSEKVPLFGDGEQWHRSYIIKLLDESPAVIGTYVPHVMDYQDGKKTRKPLAPLPGYFPAAVDQVLFQKVRAMRNGTQSPLRGNAAEVHNIFGGLARCGRCTSSMTLQNKGSRDVRRLVCTKARYGAGCQYTSIRYPEVEAGFLRDHSRILALTPGPSRDFARELEDDEEKASTIRARIHKLELRQSRTGDPEADPELASAHEELRLVLEHKKTTSVEMDAVAGQLVHRRAQDLLRLMKTKPLARAEVNACMRALFSGLSINPDTGTASLTWRHGGQSEFVFGFPQGNHGEAAQ